MPEVIGIDHVDRAASERFCDRVLVGVRGSRTSAFRGRAAYEASA